MSDTWNSAWADHVEAALALHRDDTGGDTWCSECEQDWPCPTYLLLRKALP